MTKLNSFEIETSSYNPVFLDNNLFQDPYESYEDIQNFSVSLDLASDDDEYINTEWLHYEVDSLI